MNRESVAEALANSGLVSREEVAEIAVEGNWIGVLLGKESAGRKELKPIHNRLRERFPEAEVELRAPATVFRGGAGFGVGRHVVAVLGGKGGVGKSTVAVNLALTLAAMGFKVGVLDGDINGPDVPHLLGFHRREKEKGGDNPTPADVARYGLKLHTMALVPPSRRRQPHRRFDIELMSVGFVVPEGAPTMLHGRVWVASLLRYLLFDVNWQADVLLIDAPPGTGDELHIMSRDLPLSGALFVTTPQDLAQMDAERTLTLLRKNDVPVIGLIQNMANLACPHCGKEIDMFGQTTRLADAGVDVLGRIPFDVRLSTAADRGQPLVLADGNGPIAREFARVGIAVRRWLRELEAG